MPERMQNIKVVCKGGQVENLDVLTTGLTPEILGYAKRLVNYEPSLEGGYARVKGYTKYSSTQVTGDSGSPILGVKVAHDGVYTARLNVAETGVDLFYGIGTTWTDITATTLSASTTKVRFISFSISQEVVIACNGLNPARRYTANQTETIINGTGSPSAPKYAEMVLNRLVLAPASNASSIALSAPNAETDFDSANGAIEINVGDVVTGLKRFREKLYIFCEGSIFRLDGSTEDDFVIVPITRSLGCLSHDSIQESAGDLIFLFADGLHSLAATERIGDLELGIVNPQIQPTVRTLIANLDEDDISSCLIRTKSQYRIFFQEEVDNDLDASAVLGKSNRNQTYEWAELQGFNAYCADSEYLSSGTEVAVFGHPTDGYVYKQETGNTLGGTTEIPYLYETHGLMYNDDVLRKILQKITVYIQAGGDTEVELDTYLDFGDNDLLQPATITINLDGTTATWGSAVWDTATYGSVNLTVVRKNLIGSCHEAAFIFSGTTDDESHRIDSFTIQYLSKEQD